MKWQANMDWELAKKRHQFIQQIREFFHKRNIVEVETPLLSQGTITDIHIDSFSTKYKFLEENERRVFLQTSPEFCMKRLLASGYGDIFQICKAFRDEPYGKHHNPEFTILEWYRLGVDHFQLMKEVETLLIDILSCQPAEYISYQQAFIKHIGIDPLETSDSALKDYLRNINKLDSWLIESTNIDTLLQFIFSECIEVHLGQITPCFVFGFPKSQASLATINIDDNRIADRFECYFKGFELVNGFNELTDVDIQRQRFLTDNHSRSALGFENKPLDENFLGALKSGLPQCAGVALGVDRLFMILMKLSTINSAMTFSIDNA